jgi:MoaA/NifB/PqqE/SkfB family radical SAM enzyme
MEARMTEVTTGAQTQPEVEPAASGSAFDWKLWIYTNYDCNLSCTYCVAESSPHAARRGLSVETVHRVVDEAVALGFQRLFFTGGEPFLLDDIYVMLAHAVAQAETTVLTNASLLRGSRLDRLAALPRERLVVQVSLDGARPEHHDPYRGVGSWERTVEGIRLLLARGLNVRLATTETPANRAHIEELQAFRRALGIPDEAHFVRPLARRGFAKEGLAVDADSLMPEMTVTVDGVFWHPLAAPSSTDMRVSPLIFPLADAVAVIQQRLAAVPAQDKGKQKSVQ